MVSMEQLITSYGLPYTEFHEILSSTNCLVAGSAALSMYLQQEGIDPGFYPNDIDIWVEDTRQLVASSGAYQQFGNRYIFINFLIKNGFNVTCKYEPKREDYEPLHKITEILSFMNREGKEIQIVLLTETDLIRYVRENFDLSICMSWWNAWEERFENLWPEETLRKEMMFTPVAEKTERESERVQKYEERGFRLVERSCPAVGHRDRLTGLSELAGQVAFDTISYDEVDCAEFLRASSWHVLLRVGEQFHAFHRATLNQYLDTHLSHHPQLGDLYDTPHKHTISSPSKVWLNWSDYAIAVLVPEYSIAIGNQTKSLYECRFYTVEQWVTEGGVPGAVSSMSLSEDEIHAPNVPLSADIPLYHPDVYWMDG